MTFDARVANHGSLALVHLETVAAREWVDQHVSSDAQFFGRALAVEPRYLEDLLIGMSDAGLLVE